MTEALDPYHRWLGIQPKHQPPNHYRLLGIELFESDPEVIRDAAARQMTHVRTYQLGQYADLSQQILNELATAEACLRDPATKAKYDKELRRGLDAHASDRAPPVSQERISEGRLRAGAALGAERAEAVAHRVSSDAGPMHVRRATRIIPINRPVAIFGALAGLALLFVLLIAWIGTSQFSSGRTALAPTFSSAPTDIPATVTTRPSPGSAAGALRARSTEPGIVKSQGEKPLAVQPLDTPSTVPSARSETRESPAELQSATADHLGLQVEIMNSIGMKLVLIPPGEFVMGSPDSDAHAEDDEKPQHRVRISKPFYLATTEVTQAQYEQVIGANPSRFKDDHRRPVEMVSWEDAIEFCRRLSAKEGKIYRLPTEAEWEYASRAGSDAKWCFGDDESQLGDYAWYSLNLGGTTHPVGQKKPNAWGLYDMHGNVWEPCAEWHSKTYGAARAANSAALLSRIIPVRGGSWNHPARGARSADRSGIPPDFHNCDNGIRVARDL